MPTRGWSPAAAVTITALEQGGKKEICGQQRLSLSPLFPDRHLETNKTMGAHIFFLAVILFFLLCRLFLRTRRWPVRLPLSHPTPAKQAPKIPLVAAAQMCTPSSKRKSARYTRAGSFLFSGLSREARGKKTASHIMLHKKEDGGKGYAGMATNNTRIRRSCYCCCCCHVWQPLA
nr:hypothetical protein [Pandoravirus massiliensis]